MFSWALENFEQISTTLAPPPNDASSRLVYCVQRGDEQGAIICIKELPGAGAIVNAAKGQVALHLACQTCMEGLIRALVQMPGATLDVRDAMGNTPLHLACMTKNPNVFDVVKMLVKEYKAPVTVANNEGKTPYDVTVVSTVRQFLLPLQLQRETQTALDNGGAGLPPGIDLGGLKIKNSALPPPPSGMGMSPPSGGVPPPGSDPAPAGTPLSGGGGLPGTATAGMPPPPVSEPLPSAPNQTQSSYTIAESPASGPREYALTGSSSAAIYKPSGRGGSLIQPDGFHSSSSDKRLQQKYGHSSYNPKGGVPPPPTSGNSLTGISGNGNNSPHPASAPPSLNNAGYKNPYAAGGILGSAARPGNRRYVAVDPVTGNALTSPTSMFSGTGQTSPFAPPPPVAASNFTMFNPSGAASQNTVPVSSPAADTVPPAPHSGSFQSSPYQQQPQPQPQQQHQQQVAASASPFTLSSSHQHAASTPSPVHLSQQQQSLQPASAGGVYSPPPVSGSTPSSMFSAPPNEPRTALQPPLQQQQQQQQQQPPAGAVFSPPPAAAHNAIPSSRFQPPGAGSLQSGNEAATQIQSPMGGVHQIPQAQVIATRFTSGESASSIFSSPNPDGVEKESKPAVNFTRSSSLDAANIFASPSTQQKTDTKQQESAPVASTDQAQGASTNTSSKFAMPPVAKFEAPSAITTSDTNLLSRDSIIGKPTSASSASSLFAKPPEESAAQAVAQPAQNGEEKPSDSSTPQTGAGVGEQTDEDVLDDVPLSPEVEVFKTPVDKSVCSSIGMPPPPFSRK